MSQELSTEVSPEIISSILLTGDISKLTPVQKISYYNGMCKTLGLNPLTQPFVIVKFKGKETLYATKGCTQQLSDVRKINTEVTKRERLDTVYIVTCRATMGDGRYTDEDGGMSLIEPDKIKMGDNWVTNPKSGKMLVGEDLANAMMKAVTKAKRRAVLALSGLGLPDESEIMPETHPAAIENGKSRVENIIDQQAEPQQFITEADVKKEEVIDAPKEPIQSEPKAVSKKKDVKETSKTNAVVHKVDAPAALAEGHKTIQGIIKEIPPVIGIGEPPKSKWVYVMGDAKLGTFDEKISFELNNIIKLQKDMQKGQESLPDKDKSWIMFNIEYKERETSTGKIVKDIVRFSQATQVPI